MKNKYRILQKGDNDFRPQVKFGGIIPCIIGFFIGELWININNTSYRTIDEAKDIIADYKKYPIVHEIK